MSRRVVVTGLGAISPVGNDVETMWKNLVDGVCGIETITDFDTSDLKVHIAGTVKDFDAEKYIEKEKSESLTFTVSTLLRQLSRLLTTAVFSAK